MIQINKRNVHNLSFLFRYVLFFAMIFVISSVQAGTKKAEKPSDDDSTIQLPPLSSEHQTAHIVDISVVDTNKWHPENIYVSHPDMKFVFKLPHIKDQDRSGVANLFFQCKATGKIHLLDSINSNDKFRYYNTRLSSGKYDAILLYNNGKYIRYNDVIAKKNSITEVDMKNLVIQSSDSESQQWLAMRSYNSIIPIHPLHYSVGALHLSIADTNKWHPDAIYIIHPDMEIEFKLPHIKYQDSSGVANLFFQNKETGKIHLLDTIINNKRHYTRFKQERYDAILLYNNGKYIRYNDIAINKNNCTEVNMEELNIQSSDYESQYWLTLRTFNIAIEDRVLRKNYTTSSKNNIRGYIFDNDSGESIWNVIISSSSIHPERIVMTTFDGYFEFDSYNNTNPSLNISYVTYIPKSINIKANSGLILVMEEYPESKNKNVNTGQK